jgi:hypothetical protein
MNPRGPRGLAVWAVLTVVGVACGDGSTEVTRPVPVGGAGGASEPGDTGIGGDSGMNPGTAGGPPTLPISLSPAGFAPAPPCEDIFTPVLQTFSIEISPDDWNAMHAEYVAVAMGTPGALEAHDSVRYPVVFHYGDETKPATIRLKGESSWQISYEMDGDNGKMQFVISFDDMDPSAKFHGLSALTLDMPPIDPTFLRSRIANSWLRSIGIPAMCATSARLFVNGGYYGLFDAEERAGNHYVREFFPDNRDGDLFKSGQEAETNKTHASWSRLRGFWAADSAHDLGAIVDVPRSLKSWAAEAILNDGDGYWGGGHNFLIYDQGAAGYVFLPYDLDATLDFLHRYTDDPIYWWPKRGHVGTVGQHYQIVVNDDGLRAQFTDAVAVAAEAFDIKTIQAWYDEWSAQIRDAVSADPHKPATIDVGAFDRAVKRGRDGMAARADYLHGWVACKRSGSGEDADGDGYRFCDDCRDDNASMHPGAVELCGNGADDNCNGQFDEGCPPPPPPSPPPMPPPDNTTPMPMPTTAPM